MQQHEIVVGNLFEASDKDAARLIQQLSFNSGRNQIGYLVVQGLEVNRRNVLIQNDQFYRQSLHTPVRVRKYQLPDDLNFLRVTDTEKDERRVARNAITPKSALASPVVAQHAWVGPKGGVGINQRAGQPAIDLGLTFRSIELTQCHLAVGPCQVEGAFSHAGALVFFHLRQRCFPAFGHAQNQINDGGFMGLQSNRAP